MKIRKAVTRRSQYQKAVEQEKIARTAAQLRRLIRDIMATIRKEKPKRNRPTVGCYAR